MGNSKTYSCIFHNVSGIWYRVCIWVLRVQVPITTTSKYHNLQIELIGINMTTKKQQEKIYRKLIRTRRITLWVVFYDTTETVPVAYLPLNFIYYIKSSIPENNFETTITDNIAYSLGVIIFTTNQRNYDVPISNVEGTVESVGA